MKEKDLIQQAKEIIKIASEHGVEQNYFFTTTFERYQVQIQILGDLEKAIKDDGPLVTKEYVKGRGNVYTHPAIGDYNRTATAANQTVQTLMKIIAELRTKKDVDGGEGDALANFLKERQLR